SSVFSVQRHIGAALNTSMKLCHANGCGHSREDRACSLVISAVSNMKTNGARKAIDAAISTLWLATATSSLRRRTPAGGRRLTNGAADAGGGSSTVVIAAPPIGPSGAS